jgi:predicted transcriptional regulator
VRVGDETWKAAQEIAAARGETLSDVVRRALERYVARHEDKR